jgi:hypothetical protein
MHWYKISLQEMGMSQAVQCVMTERYQYINSQITPWCSMGRPDSVGTIIIFCFMLYTVLLLLSLLSTVVAAAAAAASAATIGCCGSYVQACCDICGRTSAVGHAAVSSVLVPEGQQLQSMPLMTSLLALFITDVGKSLQKLPRHLLTVHIPKRSSGSPFCLSNCCAVRHASSHTVALVQHPGRAGTAAVAASATVAT